MGYGLRNQPFKGLYLTYQLFSTVFIRVPLWVAFAIPRSWRPRMSWSILRTLKIKLIQHIGPVAATTELGPIRASPDHRAITTGVGIKGVWVPPVPDLVFGELSTWSTVANVHPIQIPGYWIDKSGLDIPLGQAPAPGEKVLYCLHGGGFISHSAHPNDLVAYIPKGLLRHVEPMRRAFSAEYRLSKTAPHEPSNPFPAALLDALAGYNYLVNSVGFAPADIILEGDSAGGNLALALTRYLVENHASGLPAPPGALLLLSPWVDLSGHAPESTRTNLGSDYLGDTTEPASYPKLAYVGPHGIGAAEFNRYISPAGPHAQARFHGWPRTFVCAGGAEVLRDQIRALRDLMRRDIGDDLTYYEADDAVHDYIVFEWFEPERTETLKAIAGWVGA
ncbi:hypothetical protein PLICRDRAFT_32564 [Plicaturopsis crispa FD-325 SS-3]|uniref:Alpha/beta hydrolase fold-3 domain-containing protein n=1 Tax=Plicaturopsis crispa FD-325 SS-3 TaxID=944288 RepID=A0A0C9T7L5_PLICR|nr:hypothetical protein PLICRDRAFT_32564 [Plicaturopsis crispa FD-325 SS-3]